MAINPIRGGFHTVTPYLCVAGAARLIPFLERAFGAEAVDRKDRADGSVMHAEVRLGNSMIMLGEANDEFGPMPTSVYLYMPDCDAVYQRAIAAGGTSIFDIRTLPNGERYGGVKDVCGNIWWIASHVEDVTPEEEARRWQTFKR